MMPNPERTEGGLVEALTWAANESEAQGDGWRAVLFDDLADQLEAWHEHGPERKTCAESDDALLGWLWEISR